MEHKEWLLSCKTGDFGISRHYYDGNIIIDIARVINYHADYFVELEILRDNAFLVDLVSTRNRQIFSEWQEANNNTILYRDIMSIYNNVKSKQTTRGKLFAYALREYINKQYYITINNKIIRRKL